jgi:hypothetical protein
MFFGSGGHDISKNGYMRSRGFDTFEVFMKYMDRIDIMRRE